MAVRRKLGNFAEMMLKQYMAQRQARYESDLIKERQNEAAQQQFDFSTLGRVQQDPALAQRLLKSGRSKIGSFNTQDFIPTQEEAQGSIAEDIRKDPSKFDPLSIISQYNSTPGAAEGPDARAPIEQLINQRNQAREQQRNMTPQQMVEAVSPTGAK